MADDISDPMKPITTGAGNRVDEALGQSGTAARQGWADSEREELMALSAEIADIKASLQKAAQASSRAVKEGAASLGDELASQVRARPLAAVALAAFAGYVWGLTR